MVYTFEQIIKILPFEVGDREALLKTLDGADDSAQFSIKSRVWEAFTDYKQQLIDAKKEVLFAQSIHGDLQGNNRLLENQAEDAVDAEFDEVLNGKAEEKREINELREQLKKITKGI